LEKEISSGTMLGIVLIALAAVIGLGFGVFSIAKGVANEGVVNVQESLQAVSLSAFEDFDQKVVTGTRVRAALQTFEGKPIAILVSTRSFNENQRLLPGIAAPLVLIYNTPPLPVSFPTNGINISAGASIAMINYNVLLAQNSGGSAPHTTTSGASGGARNDELVASAVGPAGGVGAVPLKLVNGVVTTFFGFAGASGGVLFNRVVQGVKLEGNAEFIDPSVNFHSNLVKDMSGTIIGIAFRQI